MNSGENRASPSQRSRFAIEIAVVLGVKAALMVWLWAAFFSAPVSRQLTERRVVSDLFGPVNAATKDSTATMATMATMATASSQREAPHGPRP